MFSLELLQGDSNEYTQYTIVNTKKKITYVIQNMIMSAAIGCFPGEARTNSK